MTGRIDWDSLTAEAVELLGTYLRIDTSNPPGNEAAAVAFLSEVLGRNGIACETAESAPHRDNLIARLGSRLGGICLLNHTDVVPVERQYWDVDPFAGEVRDGVIWGRGALDMKGMGIIELMVLLLCKRLGLPLRRPLSFLAAADEEAGSAFGMAWLADHRPGWLECDLVINEGAYGLAIGNEPGIFQAAATEKAPFWLSLTARGRPGHGSVPHLDNCADRLVRALGRIAAWQQPLRLTPVMQAHIDAMRKAGFYASRNIDELARQSPAMRARLSNTISLTTISTGIKVNVIPAEAHATLDCRLLPDEDADEFLSNLRQVVNDERIDVEVLNSFEGAESSMETEFVTAVRSVITELSEGARLIPEMTSGFTDSRIFRVRGVPAYGFVPCLVAPRELAGVHGHNERISIENLRLGMQILFEVVRRLVC